MAAAAWNLKQWLLAIFWLFFPWQKLQVYRIPVVSGLISCWNDRAKY
jgi:hypothetical protein